MSVGATAVVAVVVVVVVGSGGEGRGFWEMDEAKGGETGRGIEVGERFVEVGSGKVAAILTALMIGENNQFSFVVGIDFVGVVVVEIGTDVGIVVESGRRVVRGGESGSGICAAVESDSGSEA